jgi:hypothetical protein
VARVTCCQDEFSDKNTVPTTSKKAPVEKDTLKALTIIVQVYTMLTGILLGSLGKAYCTNYQQWTGMSRKKYQSVKIVVHGCLSIDIYFLTDESSIMKFIVEVFQPGSPDSWRGGIEVRFPASVAEVTERVAAEFRIPTSAVITVQNAHGQPLLTTANLKEDEPVTVLVFEYVGEWPPSSTGAAFASNGKR